MSINSQHKYNAIEVYSLIQRGNGNIHPTLVSVCDNSGKSVVKTKDTDGFEDFFPVQFITSESHNINAGLGRDAPHQEETCNRLMIIVQSKSPIVEHLIKLNSHLIIKVVYTHPTPSEGMVPTELFTYSNIFSIITDYVNEYVVVYLGFVQVTHQVTQYDAKDKKKGLTVATIGNKNTSNKSK